MYKDDMKLATINVQTLQDDMKLATNVQTLMI